MVPDERTEGAEGDSLPLTAEWTTALIYYSPVHLVGLHLLGGIYGGVVWGVEMGLLKDHVGVYVWGLLHWNQRGRFHWMATSRS